MNKELLTKAVSGDTAALSTLRRTVSPSLKVFVAPAGKVDVPATLAAYQYYVDNGFPPDEWNDEPTVTFAQAFPAKVRRNPLTLKPITPGLWTRVWESDGGPTLVAAIWWGRQHGHIRDTDPEIKVKVRARLHGTEWALLTEVIKMMQRDERQAQAAMNMVYAPMEHQVQETVIVTAAIVPGVEKRAGLQSALETLEQEYNCGMIDIGRYTRLRENIYTKLQGCYGNKWTQAKVIALRDFIVKAYSLSDLKTLCFQVGVCYDDLAGDGLSMKALRLIDNRQRRGLLDEVGELCKRQRPAMWAQMMSMHE